MKKSVNVFFLFLLIFLPERIFALKSIVVDDKLMERILTFDDVEILEDATKTLTIHDVSSAGFSTSFVRNNDFYATNKNIRSAYWVRFKLDITEKTERKWIIESYDQTIDNIEAYIPDGKGNFIQLVSGDKLPFNERQFKHKNFEFQIPENVRGENIFYFRVESSHLVNIILVIRSIEQFIYYALNEYLFFGIFYGMILIIAVYNFLMFLAIKEKAYIYYICYCFFVGVYFMCTEGIAFQYLWPEFPLWNQNAWAVALYLLIISALLYCRYFFNTRQLVPRLDRILLGLIFFRSLYFIVSMFFNQDLLEYKVIELIPLIFIFYVSIYTLVYKNFRPARFFVMAYGILFVGFIVRLLIFLDVILFTTYTYYTLNFSFTFEMLFLSFAMADKVKIIKEEKEKAQFRVIEQLEENEKLKDKVNRELEEKVKDRTIQLHEANKLLEESNIKLQDQAEQISKMNQVLDLDNWKLKKNIEEVQFARILKKNIDFEEFKKVFPDEMACLRYLAEVKWSESFSCKKCSNDKCFDGLKQFSKRCTKCGYNESVTAFTIFHAAKFSLQKAFFIVYMVITERNDITIKELSEVLELRRNTCWNFRKKIESKIDSARAKKAREAMKDWGHVVFRDT